MYADMPADHSLPARSPRPLADRYAYVTKKALQHVLPRIGEMDLHAGVTLEGRDDDELPEQVLFTARIRRFDLLGRATEVEL